MSSVQSAGRLLRQARHDAGLTQAQVGQRAGVSQSVISAYEAGRRQPSLPTLTSLLAATGHTLDASLVAIGDPPPAHPSARAEVAVSSPDSQGPLSGPLGRRVRLHRQAITATAASYGVVGVRVFGSVARGGESSDSDVDLLIDLPEETGLFALGRLRADLEQLLDARVDLVPAAGLKDDVRSDVEADALLL